MPKVLRIINRLNLGGPTFNAALLTKHLAPEYETMLVAGTKMDSEESSEFICRDLGIDFVSLPEMRREVNLLKDYAAYQKLKKIIRDFKPDIVHTHAAKAGALGRFAAAELKVPVIVHTFHGHVFHSYFNPVKTKIFLSVERSLAAKSSAIVAISKQQKEELTKQYGISSAEKVHVIPLGFDLDRFRHNMEEKRNTFRKTYDLAEDDIAIGIVGRLVPIKNHPLFLSAIKKLMDENTGRRIRAFIIGDGEELAHLQHCCQSLALDFVFKPEKPVQASVTFTSWLKNVDEAMAGLDIVALTSFNEGTPVSLIEAQAAGKPIVSTRVGGIENIVKEKETALLVKSHGVDEFAENLRILVENKDLRQQMASRGWENVRESFHYTRLVNDMKALYSQLLRQNAPK